jgi:hypothetical protein
MAGVGTILSKYFTDKRFLSNTTLNDPPISARLLRHLDPYIEGASLAGAGGGGFLAALLKPNLTREDVVSKVRAAMAKDTLEQQQLQQQPPQEGDESEGLPQDEDLMWAWEATIDVDGLVVQIES